MSYDISFFTVEGGLSPEESFESKCCSVADQGLPAEDLGRAKQLETTGFDGSHLGRRITSGLTLTACFKTSNCVLF